MFRPGMQICICSNFETGDIHTGVIAKVEGQWVTVRWEATVDEYEDDIPLPNKLCSVSYLEQRLRK